MGLFGNKKQEAIDATKEGVSLFKEVKFSEALQAFDHAVILDPNNVIARRNKAITLVNLSRSKEALQECDRGFALNPNDAGLWYVKGEALNNLGLFREAIQAYDRAIALNPNDPGFRFTKGTLLSSILGRPEEAIREYEQAIVLDPNNARYWDEKARILRNLGRFEEAIQAYDRAIAIDPSAYNIRKRRKDALSELNKLQAAAHPVVQEVAPVSVSPTVTKTSPPASALNEKPIEILCTIIRNHGISSIDNKDAFNGILRDYYKGEYKRETIILAVLSAQLAQRLDDCGFSQELAVWAVYAWARALGVEMG
jgi:superkiller protein 3